MKKLKSIMPIYIIINLLYILIGNFLVTNKNINYKLYSKGYIVLLIINLLIIITNIIIKIIKKEKIKFKITDLLTIIITILGIISTIFAIKQNVALFGHSGRFEGLFTICYYFSLFILSSNVEKKYKKLISYSILVVGLINYIYAFLQVNDFFSFIVRRYRFKEIWATGLVYNPNFLAELMLICLSLSLGLYIENKNRIEKIIDILFIFCFYSGLLISNTMSCFVGLMAVIIYFLFYLIREKKYKKIIILLIIIPTTIYYACIGQTTILSDYIKTGTEIKEISKGNIQENFGTNRMFIWKNTLKIVPKYIIHGAGIDNFYYAFGDKPLSRKRVSTNTTVVFDKAHNEYLQILVCEGIFCLIAYLVFYAIIVITGIKNSLKNKSIYLILPIIGYLVQAFFNISVISVAPIFYILLGLNIEREKLTKK